MAGYAAPASPSSSVVSLVLAYLLGGITFLPLLIACILLHAYLTLPRVDRPLSSSSALPKKSLDGKGIAIAASVAADDGEKANAKTGSSNDHEPSAAASYFAVCREYVPGGVNGKPPERTTPAGETIAAESPSVYQAMYRSIFDRGSKTQVPSMDTATTVGGRTIKKARNVFYVVLRHGHLLLFNNENQLEVRHVVSLANYDIDIYAGGDEEIPEGELFIKRNCIRLSRKQAESSLPQYATPSAPYYLFSDNCSEKEDFYHALLGAMEKSSAGGSEAISPPAALLYESEDMIKLIRQLHTTEDNSQTRWINALIGRIFLGVYKTGDAEQYVRNKVTKKIARVSKPSWITSLRLEDIVLGDSAPHFSNPKLKEMTVDGGLTLEADVKYTGNFKLVVAAVARLELGSRFKAREVNLVLAGTLKKLEGHLLVHIKPPPSNRLWISFETLPRIDLSIEPIVSSRQITYSVILRVIESRVREVITETVVLPNWDDTPFFETVHQAYRGGIWKSSEPNVPTESHELVTDESKASEEVKASTSSEPVSAVGTSPPSPSITATAEGFSHKRVNSLPTAGSSDGQEQSANQDGAMSPRRHSKLGGSEKPRYLRSNSFATAALPVVSKTPSVVESPRPSSRGAISKDAATAMKILHQRSPEASPVGSPHASSLTSTSLPKNAINRMSRSNSAASSKATESTIAEQLASHEDDDDLLLPFASDDLGGPMQTSHSHADGSREGKEVPVGDELDITQPATLQTPGKASTSASPGASKRTSFNAQLNAGLSSATSAAKTWGWSVLKQAQSTTPSRLPRSSGQSNPNQPVGRGQPLPPPGVPLPKPTPDTWSAATINAFRRKPVLPPRPSLRSSSSGESASSIPRPAVRGSTSRETLQESGDVIPGDGNLQRSNSRETLQAPSNTTSGGGSLLDGAVLSDGNAMSGSKLDKAMGGSSPSSCKTAATKDVTGEIHSLDKAESDAVDRELLSVGVKARNSKSPTPTTIESRSNSRQTDHELLSVDATAENPGPSTTTTIESFSQSRQIEGEGSSPTRSSSLQAPASTKRAPAALTAATLAFAGPRSSAGVNAAESDVTDIDAGCRSRSMSTSSNVFAAAPLENENQIGLSSTEGNKFVMADAPQQQQQQQQQQQHPGHFSEQQQGAVRLESQQHLLTEEHPQQHHEQLMEQLRLQPPPTEQEKAQLRLLLSPEGQV